MLTGATIREASDYATCNALVVAMCLPLVLPTLAAWL
jgi:hypothetical protein